MSKENIENIMYGEIFIFTTVVFSVNSLVMKYFTGLTDARYICLATGLGALMKFGAAYLLRRGGKFKLAMYNNIGCILALDIVITICALALGYNSGDGAPRYLMMTLSNVIGLIVAQVMQEQINKIWSGIKLTRLNQGKEMARNAAIVVATVIGFNIPESAIEFAMAAIVVVVIIDSFVLYNIATILKRMGE